MRRGPLGTPEVRPLHPGARRSRGSHPSPPGSRNHLRDLPEQAVPLLQGAPPWTAVPAHREHPDACLMARVARVAEVSGAPRRNGGGWVAVGSPARRC